MRIIPLLLCLLGTVLFGANLTLHVSFDKGLAADVANGKREPDAVQSNVAYQEDGVSGKGIKIGPWKNVETPGTTEVQDRNYRYVYSGMKNLNSEKGAMSFWVKPVDWDGKDAAPHRLFVHLNAPNKATMTIYKVLNNPSLYCHIVSQGVGVAKPMGRIADWKKGEWHHIVVCWEKGALSTFVDGVMGGTMSFNPFDCQFTQIVLGRLGWQFESGASAMDELRVYDAPLSMNEIEGLYNGSAKVGKGEMRLNVGKAKKAPVVDGIIGKDEYVLGAAGFIQYNKRSLIPKERQVEYYLSHDGERLYVGMASPAPVFPKVQKFMGRDGNVWEDETVEIHIDVIGKKQYQFIMNPSDGIYDSRNRDTSWNSENAVHKSVLRNGIWSFEFSIPFSDIDLTGDSIAINLCRSYQTPLLLSCLVPVTSGYAQFSNFCKVKLLPQVVEPVQLVSIDGLSRKRLELYARGVNGGKCCVSYGGKERDEIALADDYRSIVRENIGAGCPVEITLSTADGQEVYSNTLEVSRILPLTMNYIYTDIATETIKIAATSLLDKSARGKLLLEISKRFGGEKVDSVEIPLGKSDGNTFEIPYRASHLPYGHYVLEGTYISPLDEKMSVFKEEWVRPEKQKIIDYYAAEMVKVQPPWQPLQFSGRTVFTAFNDCTFGESSPYVSQVTAMKRKLFAGGSFIEIDGKRDASMMQMAIRNEGDYCMIRQTCTFPGGLKIEMDSTMEFDGMVKTRMELVPPAEGIDINSLKLCFPLQKSLAKYVNAFNGFGNEWGKSGVLSDEKEWRTDIYKFFSFWIGDEKAGFSFACRNTKGWHCRDTGKSFQLLPAEYNMRLAVLNIIDTPMRLKERRHISFAVMPSPSRPLSQELLRTQFRKWSMWSGYYSLFYDYHEPEFLQSRPGNPNYFHYIGIGISPHSPAFNYYQQDWNCGTLGAVAEDIIPKNLAERNRVHFWSGCLNSDSFLNYKIDRVKFIINYEPLKVHNLYFDLMRGHACSSKGHGCVWKDDFGREWKSFDWEGRRVLLREVREELLKKNPNGYISLHSHNQRLPMILSFGDMHVGGEDFVYEVGREGNYYDIVNSQILRAYSTAYGSGLKCLFIPQLQRSLMFVKPGTTFDEKLPKNILATRHIALMLLIHDVDGWTAMNEFKRIWDFESEFGWDKDVIFEPFWDNHELFEIASDSTGGKVIASVFRREGRFMFATLNDSGGESDATVHIDFKRLLGKDAPSRIRDCFEPDAKYTVKDGTVDLHFKPREGKILWFE